MRALSVNAGVSIPFLQLLTSAVSSYFLSVSSSCFFSDISNSSFGFVGSVIYTGSKELSGSSIALLDIVGGSTNGYSWANGNSGSLFLVTNGGKEVFFLPIGGSGYIF